MLRGSRRPSVRYVRVREREIDIGRLLGVIGGIVALVSLFLPWILISGECIDLTIYRGEYTLWNVLDASRETGGNPTGMYVVLLLVAAGGLVSLARPAGGVLVVFGWLLFAFAFARYIVSQEALTCGLEIGFATGFWVCIGASITSLAGTAVPRL